MIVNSIKKIRLSVLIVVLAVIGCGGGSDSATPPAPPTPPPSPPPVQVTDSNRIDAARLLTQATFGARLEDIEETAEKIARAGVESWIDDQIAVPITLHLPMAQQAFLISPDPENRARRRHRMEAWWRASIYGEDQLRQRVAFALSQLFVVSENSQLNGFQRELANYYDLLLNNAFGNYRELMEDVTTSPVMGLYLSMLANEKPQPERNIRPDENFARELMQLFTIGLVELNMDGSPIIDSSGQMVPTYDQDIIEAYAHVFTGWHFDGTTANNWYQIAGRINFFDPMTLVPAFHDTGEKVLLNNQVIPAGTDGNIALDIALDSLFEHPNLAPFVSKHLIKNLVTSNPSPQYVERVASVFVNNGNGVRGDLESTIKAILTDDEARLSQYYSQPTFGKVKEPLLRSTAIIRALLPTNTLPTSQDMFFRQLTQVDFFTAQAPLASPSVFNFFSPDHQVNGELSALDMVSPELEILTTNYIIRNSNFAAYYLYLVRPDAQEPNVYADVSRFVNGDFVEEDVIKDLSLVFLQGTIDDEFSQVLLDYDEQIAPFVDEATRVREWINLIITSPQFAIQL